MARRKQTYCYFSESVPAGKTGIELEESDVWGEDFHSQAEESAKVLSVLLTNNKSKERTRRGAVVGSLPVDIPPWSRMVDEDDDYDDEEETVVPPHEYLRRRRMRGVVSFSVHEGVGRTLKGRDLSWVRNAVLGNVGFQD